MSEERCPDCGEQMLQVTVPGTQRKVHAHCCPPQREADAREWEQRRQSAITNLREREANLPQRMDHDLAGWKRVFQVDTANCNAVHEVSRFAQVCTTESQPDSGLTLAGAAGAGKTTLVVALGRTLARSGVRVRFENMPDLVSELRGLIGEGRFQERMKALQRVPVLILDDLGREQVSYFSVETVLYNVVDARYRAGKPLILTTNYERDQLGEIYGRASNERGDVARNAPVILDRLREVCPWLPINGQSRRKPRFF